MFIKKRKKPDDGVALSEDEFKVVKAQMQASVNGVEQQMSSSAEKPSELVRGAKMPQPSAQEMMTVALLKADYKGMGWGAGPPEWPKEPPRVCRQKAEVLP